ncbi:hypothetical protein SAMN05216389_109160 [Oceanobacillus limi]|uniref:Sulfurtransferase n=1 Tax=Oceanobacillus limi TaxID=930131 RepID=A0A1I0DU27_9BACI|nr:hypothetical protein [Oceanobacillus limi]SET35957.1 hypothetical protein SAMN05216389_109160 [Oceanobacillus limi]
MALALLSVSLIILLLYFLYRRYIPVFGLTNLGKKRPIKASNGAILLDVRAYNISCNNRPDMVMCLPLAYFNRYYKEIPNEPVILVASNGMEKNLASRFLKNKGYNVIGYYLVNKTENQRLCCDF